MPEKEMDTEETMSTYDPFTTTAQGLLELWESGTEPIPERVTVPGYLAETLIADLSSVEHNGAGIKVWLGRGVAVPDNGDDEYEFDGVDIVLADDHRIELHEQD